MSEVPIPGEDESIGHEVQVADKEQAREIVDLIKERGARLVEQAAQLEAEKEDFATLVGFAYKQQAWIALGYSSWEALARAELSEARFFDTLPAHPYSER